MKKKIARFLGIKLPYFKGKNKIIRFLYPTNKFKSLNNGEEFIVDYFNKKYHGITSNYIDWGVYFYGGLEKGLVKYIKSQINSFEYFLDIGSNSGTLSLPFIDENNLKIICFEPLKYNYEKLIKNYRLNNALRNNEFHNIALSDKSGDSYINFNEVHENIGTASIDENRQKNNEKKEKIKIEKLDNLYQFKNKNIFIKIDVEGHEKEVLDGSIDILKNNKILMYLETRNDKLLEDLKNLNFKIFYPFIRENTFKFIKKRYVENVILKNF
jgi:FkbM family methyltransferase